MNKKVVSLFSAALISSFIGSSAVAEGYLGGSFGSADIEGTDDSSIKVFGGYRQGNFGFEAAYHDLGKQEETEFGLTAAMEVTGMEFSAIGFLAANPSFDLFGKIGLFFWDADLSLTGFQSVSEDGSDFIIGVGGQYNLSQNASVRFEYQMTTLDVNGVDFDTDVVSVGASYNF